MASVIVPPILEECAREPIHVPGSIQPHGALLAIDPTDFAIVQASANTGTIVGINAEELLGRSALDLFPEIDLKAFLGRSGGRVGPASAGTIVVEGRNGETCKLGISRSPCGRISMELEPIGSDHLRDGIGNVMALAQSVVLTLREATSTAELLSRAVREIRRFTRHDRTMVYRFHYDGHGEVVAEDVIPGLDSLLGLHYPAADVPAQARRMYLAQRVRVIEDIRYRPVPMVGHSTRAGPPLDMTYCALRSVSPIHLEYLGNMEVRATLTVSIIGHEGELWGMLVCHSIQPLPVPPELRAVVDLIGQLVSVILVSLHDVETLAEQLSRERDLRTVSAALADANEPVQDAAARSADGFLSATRSTGAAIRVDGQTTFLGLVPPEPVAEAIIDALWMRGDGTAASTSASSELVPGMATHAATAAGVFVLGLPRGGGDVVAWFRHEVAATVKWGGDPTTAVVRDKGTGRLSPRASFATWREEISGHSLPWTAADRSAAFEVRRLLTNALVRRAESELARLRYEDQLTGLPNRRLMQERLEALDAAHPGKTPDAALIYIDLDRFKDINDTLGHGAGDTLLIQVASRLKAAAEPGFTVARIGGDEFGILCEQLDPDKAVEVAKRIRTLLEAPFEVNGHPYLATASVGMAHSAATGRTGSTLLHAADAAMYVAKREGGNTSANYAETLRTETTRRFRLEQDLRAALANNGYGLFLHYQPIVSTRNGALLGFEALSRWKHADRGMVPPSEFVPAAEATGLGTVFGQWVVETALNEAAAWQEAMRSEQPTPYIAINASPRQLATADFAGQIGRALALRDLSPSSIQVEVTEAIVADATATRTLAALQSMGIRIAIDDFGTGYSSLSYLRELPAEIVKLDRSFLPGLKRLDDAALLAEEEGFMAAVLGLAQRAGFSTIVEGIETQAHLRAATVTGAGCVQGFLIARPMPSEEARALVAAIGAAQPLPWAGLMTDDLQAG